jgi:soluble lytic murein transglycosylase
MLRPFLLLCLLAFITLPAHAQSQAARAAKSAQKGDWVTARNLVVQTRDPAAGAVYEWLLYTDAKVDGLPFDRVANFIKRNPNWPRQELLKRAAEKALEENRAPSDILAWFQAYPPVSILGLQKYIQAAQRANDETLARRVLNESWPTVFGDTEDQNKFLNLYGRSISADSHRRRIDHLLFNERTTQARALAARLGQGYPELVAARIALATEAAGVEGLLARVPRTLQNDPGLLYERLRFRRKNDQDAGALSILNNPPPSASLSNPEEWWKERNIIARRLMEARNFREAYRVASNHQQMEGQEYADAEWLSGWLALRFLNDPQRAAQHFEMMNARVKTAISKARATYWAGRAYEAMNNQQKANDFFRQASSFPKTYYGQLAQKHMKGASQIDPVPAVATDQDVAALRANILFRAAMIFDDANMDRERNLLLKSLAESLDQGGQLKALAQELTRRNLQSEALKVAKIASGKNIFLADEAYPRIPNLTRGLSGDKALIHALIRQESQFDKDAESSAGALGLMQLMPTTARDVARRLDVNYSKERLTNDPRYNVQLGTAYLNRLLERFGNSYPLALASYNAGSGRVAGWIKDMGDPRLGKHDWVDWIEMIPIYETRNYVQRVMENYIVYRDHLGVR